MLMCYCAEASFRYMPNADSECIPAPMSSGLTGSCMPAAVSVQRLHNFSHCMGSA